MAAVAAVLGLAVFVPAASAEIAPTLTLSPSTPFQAGASSPLTTDIVFAPSNPATDSVKDITEILPPGLLSDASINGGKCIKSAPPASGLPAAACKIGTGEASVVVNGTFSTTQPLSLYLVAPPQTSDLAGIAIYNDNTVAQLGSAGDVSVRPSADPAGVGIDITFTNVPDSVSFGGPPVSLSIKELKTTIDAMRMPARCPSPEANYTVNADSYSDPAMKSTSAPLKVAGCSSLKLTPTFKVTAVRDTGDAGVKVTTDLKQPSSSSEATSSKVVLSLPPKVLGPNVGAVLRGGILCSDPTFASCKAIGTATSASPLYPHALSGRAFLTGSLAAPAIALVFPPPFPITLAGAVDIATGMTTFTGVPDLPLTDLQVVLTGGPDSVFTPSCNPASGTASSVLTSQNGDKTATAEAPFAVSNCPAPSTGPKPPVVTPAATAPVLRSLTLRKAGPARFVLRVSVVAGTHAARLRSVSVTLPHRLRFLLAHGRRPNVRKRVSIRGGGIASAKLVKGRLFIKFGRPVEHLFLSVRGLTAGTVGHATKRARRRHLRIGVTVTDADGKVTRFPDRSVRFRQSR